LNGVQKVNNLPTRSVIVIIELLKKLEIIVNGFLTNEVISEANQLDISLNAAEHSKISNNEAQRLQFSTTKYERKQHAENFGSKIRQFQDYPCARQKYICVT
jgi:hypothetical protein